MNYYYGLRHFQKKKKEIDLATFVVEFFMGTSSK